jgi:hypothetical protein
MSVRRYSSTRANIFGDLSTNGLPLSSRASGWRPENMAASIDCGCLTSVERNVQKTVPPTLSSTSTCEGDAVLAGSGEETEETGTREAAKEASSAATRRSVLFEKEYEMWGTLTQAGHHARLVHGPSPCETRRAPETNLKSCVQGLGRLVANRGERRARHNTRNVGAEGGGRGVSRVDGKGAGSGQRLQRLCGGRRARHPQRPRALGPDGEEARFFLCVTP